MALGTELLIKGHLPARVREVVILRVAWRTGSVYEWGQHVRIGRDSGLDDDEIAGLATEAAAVDLVGSRAPGRHRHRRALLRRPPDRRHLVGRGGGVG